MAIDVSQMKNLLLLAKYHYYRAQRSCYECDRALNTNKSIGTWLGIGTIALAVVTAFTAYASLKWVPVISSILTAIVRGVELQFRPSQNAENYTRGLQALEESKQRLCSFAVSLDGSRDFDTCRSNLDSLGKDIDRTTQQAGILPPASDSRAQEDADKSVISQIMKNLKAVPVASPGALQEPQSAAPAGTKQSKLRVMTDLSKDADGKIRYRLSTGGGRQYKVKLWLSGPKDEINGIEQVNYRLGSPFDPPVRTANDPVSGFEVEFWTSRQFLIEINVQYQDGTSSIMSHSLEYKRPKNEDAYVLVE